jgi:hypothetical protein
LLSEGHDPGVGVTNAELGTASATPRVGVRRQRRREAELQHAFLTIELYRAGGMAIHTADVDVEAAS